MRIAKLEDIMSPKEFLDKLVMLELQDNFIYYTGFLAIDRQQSGEIMLALNRLTILTRLLETFGTILMYSRKLEESRFSYIAYKRREQILDLSGLLEEIESMRQFEEPTWYEEKLWQMETQMKKKP